MSTDEQESLGSHFLARAPEAARDAWAGVADLEAQLAALLEAAREAAPEVGLGDYAVIDAIAARVPFDEELPAALAALGSLEAGDVLLAEGCARGDAASLRAFERRFGADLDVAIAKSPSLGVGKDDFRQLVREHFFVASPGRPPRIAGYSGRGPLRAWVRVAATRLVIDLSRRPAQPELRPEDELDALLPPPSDPELAYLRHAYGAHLSAAFADALAKLTPRQRNLLRQKHVHELTGDRLAAMYGVHRATVFGWIEDARKALLAQLRVALRVRTAGQDLDSVVHLVGSRLDLSVRRLLDSRIEDEAR
jgi:RNA polymerase sigma-70 factor (ECF subfamily)